MKKNDHDAIRLDRLLSALALGTRTQVQNLIRSGRINCKTRKILGFGIMASGLTSGKAYITLRLWSGTKCYYQGTGTIASGKWYNLYVNLKNWKYRNKITRTDIIVSSEGGGWSGNASVSVRSFGTR